MDIIFVTILNNDKIAIQNKVALKCDTSKEDIQEVAQSFFHQVCEMDKLIPEYYSFEIFIKNADNFYKVEKETKTSKRRKVKYPDSHYDGMQQAIDAAKEYAESKGYTIDPDHGVEWDYIQPETSKERIYKLRRNGMECDKGLKVVLYKMPSGRYELVTYVN